MIETRTNLDSLEAGKEGYIVSIECEDKALRSHILNMGLTPGVEVKLIKTAPMGDPLEIRVRGYELTIRKSDSICVFLINSKSDFPFPFIPCTFDTFCANRDGYHFFI